MKLSIVPLLLAVLALHTTAAAAEPPPTPATLGLSAPALLAARARLASGDKSLDPALAKLRREADALLKREPRSVMDKSRVPPSGDKHDYLSLAPYFWPNPKTADRLPYVRRDGEVNPESKQGTDAVAFWEMGENVETLALAWFFTRDPRYAEQAARFLRAWFITPATRMNPHLEYAQGIPGENHGRGIGILESRHVTEALDATALIADSEVWTAADAKALRTWVEDYYEWVTQSKNGADERAAKNNHGSWYDAQVVHFAVYLGKGDDARRMAEAARQIRIAGQIAPDGSQPHELARTKSFDYFCFNLEALVRLARVSTHAGVDLWSFETADGRSLRKALEFVAPYADASRSWLKTDIHMDARSRLAPLLAEALQHGESPVIRAGLQHCSSREADSARWRLLLNMPPERAE